jgi:mono/diheme cytochrome c family protein
LPSSSRGIRRAERALLAAAGAACAVVLACAGATFTARPAAPGSPDAAGEKLYREHCGSCHRLRNPGDHTRERWAWAVNRFSGRAHLSPDEAKLVLDYLQARAEDAPPPAPAAAPAATPAPAR